MIQDCSIYNNYDGRHEPGPRFPRRFGNDHPCEEGEAPHRDRRKPRICQLLDGAAVAEAGTLPTLLACQFRADYHFLFVCLGDPGFPRAAMHPEELPIHVIGRRPGLDWNCSRRLERVLQREKIDLIHAHQSDAFLHGLIARLCYRNPPILLTMHERGPRDNFSPKRVVVNRMFLESRDRIVAASHAVRQALIMNEGLPPEQVDVIYNGMVPPPVTDTVRDGHSVRQEIGVEADALLILQLARFDPWQNHTLALSTMEQVVPSFPHARLVMVGEGPEQRLIRELVRQRGLGAHVLFPGPRTDHARLLAAADLVLLTASGAGVPPVLIQALAAARPVVATRVGGVAEVVEDRICGLIASPGDYGALAEGIRRLGASPELREQFGRRGRERFETRFTGANTSLGYSQMYRSMLSR